MKEETKKMALVIMRNGINALFTEAARFVGNIESVLEITEGAAFAKRAFEATYEDSKKASDKLKELVTNLKESVDELITEGLVPEEAKEQIIKNCDDCVESIDNMQSKIATLLAEPEGEKTEDAGVAGETETKEGE